MAAKLIFLMGVLGVGGYVGRTMMNHDPSLLSMSREAIETKLVDARTTLPRRDGPGEISIWSTGTSASGVKLAMRYSADSPLLTCKAVITAVEADKNRVTADCGGGGTGSAIADTTAALQAPMFEEHIAATLEGRAFNRARVDAKGMGAVMGNVGAMNREAMKMSDQMQRELAEQR